jgi:hypothetical protein
LQKAPPSTGRQGGYNLDAIAQSALAVTRVLLGEAPPRMPPMTAQAWATRTVWEVARVQKQFWNSLDVAACEPYGEREATYDGHSKCMLTPDRIRGYHCGHCR